METKDLSHDKLLQLITNLKCRFLENPERHKGLKWDIIESRIKADPSKAWSLNQMELTGGEPDVIGQDGGNGAYLFVDCSKESPSKRRSLCYDHEGLESRKANKPVNSAQDLAGEMGIQILDETEYRALQELGEFDQKTSSWLSTPKRIRELGGAIFADYRYDTVFIYHNSAGSYYSSRGFRGRINI